MVIFGSVGSANVWVMPDGTWLELRIRSSRVASEPWVKNAWQSVALNCIAPAGPRLKFQRKIEADFLKFGLPASSRQLQDSSFEFRGQLFQIIFQIPSKINRVSVPWKEILRFLRRGFRVIYQQYFSQFWGSGATPEQYKSVFLHPWGSGIYPGGTEISTNQYLYDPWGSENHPGSSRITPATPRISTNQYFFTPEALRTPFLL